jgi:protein gp37
MHVPAALRDLALEPLLGEHDAAGHVLLEEVVEPTGSRQWRDRPLNRRLEEP